MTHALRTAFASFLLLASIGSAAAVCLHNGRAYPEGTMVGNRVCVNGNWVVRR